MFSTAPITHSRIRYQSRQESRYLKLYDGGVTDNLGIHGLITHRERDESLIAPIVPRRAANLKNLGYAFVDLSDNEMAKLHVRHMVGGSAANIENERLFRFEFPERPGALLDFLQAIGTDWNISLFHYRNHGSDHGRILAGIQVADDESAELEAHLAELGYSHFEESHNPAYSMFLA